jgi:hypothetical protein
MTLLSMATGMKEPNSSILLGVPVVVDLRLLLLGEY